MRQRELRSSGQLRFGTSRSLVLGGNCEVAAKLNDNGLRKASYPFDWLLTLNHDKFLELLDNNFQFFLSEAYIFQYLTPPFTLENSYYEIEFRHEGPIDSAHTFSEH